MDVDFFDWDDEDFDRGNTRHILSAGYDPDDIEEAILGHRGPLGQTRDTGRPSLVAEIDGEDTYIVFELVVEPGGIIVVRPITAFPLED
jgi:hypothetical protein